jgi:hypothetical protein
MPWHLARSETITTESSGTLLASIVAAPSLARPAHTVGGR